MAPLNAWTPDRADGVEVNEVGLRRVSVSVLRFDLPQKAERIGSVSAGMSRGTSEGKSYADAEFVPEAAGSQTPWGAYLEELSSHGKS